MTFQRSVPLGVAIEACEKRIHEIESGGKQDAAASCWLGRVSTLPKLRWALASLKDQLRSIQLPEGEYVDGRGELAWLDCQDWELLGLPK